MVASARGGQQGYNLSPICYNAGPLKIIKEFRANPQVPEVRAASLIDGITVSLPPEFESHGSGCRNA